MRYLLLIFAIISYCFYPVYALDENINVSNTQQGSRVYVVECDDSFYPYIYFDRNANEYKGVAVDILNEVSEKYGFEYEFFRKLDMGYDDKINMLLDGKAHMFIIADRSDDDKLLFSQPVASDNYSVITHEDNSENVTSISDLELKKVGIVEGSAVQEYARQNIKNAEITYFKSYNAMYTALSAHAVDYILQKHNVYRSDYFRNELFDTKELFVIDNAQYEFCFAFKNDAEGEFLLNSVNSVIDNFNFESALSQYPDSSSVIIDRYKESKDDRWKIAVVVSLIYAVAITFAILYFYSRNNNDVLNAQLQMYETAFLKAQIKPHFLYNALGRIMSLCYVDGEKAGVLLGNLTKYLRIIYSTDNTEELITLEKEMELVESYVSIEKARYGQKIDVKYNIGKDCMDFMILPLIVQPLVENAIKHGLSKKVSGGTVNVTIFRTDDKLNITVEDDGIGMSEKALSNIFLDKVKNKGIGMANIYKRLHTYSKDAFISVCSTPEEGTKVNIVFPEKKEEKVLREYEYI